MLELALAIALQGGWIVKDDWDYCTARRMHGATEISLNNLDKPGEAAELHVTSSAFRSAITVDYAPLDNLKVTANGQRLATDATGYVYYEAKKSGIGMMISGSSLVALQNVMQNGGTIKLSGPVSHEVKFGPSDRAAMNEFWNCFNRPADEL